MSNLGDSAAGLDAILNGCQRIGEVPYLIERHYLPKPRVEEGRLLASTEGVHAMMDISDGIGLDLRHIMEESGVGMEIEMARIPVSEQLQAYCRSLSEDLYRFAASGGEDYELLFTVAPEAESTLAVEHFVIGRVTEGSELVWKGSEKDYDGFRHL